MLQKKSLRSICMHNANAYIQYKIIKEAEGRNHIQLLFAFHPEKDSRFVKQKKSNDHKPQPEDNQDIMQQTVALAVKVGEKWKHTSGQETRMEKYDDPGKMSSSHSKNTCCQHGHLRQTLENLQEMCQVTYRTGHDIRNSFFWFGIVLFGN